MTQSIVSQPAEQFHTLPLARIQADFRQLVERTALHKGRIEILDSAGVCVAVLISKEELDNLETALDLFADTPEIRRVSASLQSLAAL